MLAINKKTQEGTFHIPSVELLSQTPALSNTPKHRNSFTAKLRPRTLLSSGKGSRIEHRGASISHDQEMAATEKQYKPSQQELDGVLSQFDNLQLEDFLKVVIVGKSKLSETKSKEIIRSLNGTWFKNTGSKSPTNRLYCSLPIRKQKNNAAKKASEGQITAKWSLSEHFFKNYTPPNLFPKRKVSPPKHRSSYIRHEQPDFSSTEVQIDIKSKLAQRIGAGRQSSYQPKWKRGPSSYFSNNKQGTVLKFFEEENSCLLGKRMVIHD